jgi:organic radical activating enzyme
MFTFLDSCLTCIAVFVRLYGCTVIYRYNRTNHTKRSRTPKPYKTYAIRTIRTKSVQISFKSNNSGSYPELTRGTLREFL